MKGAGTIESIRAEMLDKNRPNNTNDIKYPDNMTKEQAIAFSHQMKTMFRQ